MHQNERPGTTDMATQQDYMKSIAKKLSLFHKREKDLGISIQENLDWDSHVVKVTNQTNRILVMIRRKYEDTI